MDERSSIFSSKRPKAAAGARRVGPPWAFLGAAVIVLAVELALHAKTWPDPIPYEQGRGEYHAVAAEIDRHGSTTIAFVGSSRTRESISVPLATSIARRELGRSVTIANYAVGGGRALDFEAIVDRLLRTRPMPRVIVIGMSERELAGTSFQYDNLPIFWNLDDWRVFYNLRGFKVTEELPTVLRNLAGRHVRLIGLRESIGLRLKGMLLGRAASEPSSPIRGEATPWHVASPKKRIDRTDPLLPAMIQQNVVRDLNPAMLFPNAAQAAALRRLADACQASDVRLIFFEMPISNELAKAMPLNSNDQTRQLVYDVTSATETRYVRLRDIDYRLSFRELRDPSHLNLLGAERLTHRLMERVIVPAVRADIDQDRRNRRRQTQASPDATTQNAAGT